MAKPTYYEMLRDPRWQKMRLEVMQRDKFACRACKDKTSTLNVHHTYYEKGKAPWEYPSYSLRTLCEPCHEYAQSRMAKLQRVVGALEPHELETAVGFCCGMLLKKLPNWKAGVETDGVIYGLTIPWFENDGSIDLMEYAEKDGDGPYITGHAMLNAVNDFNALQSELRCEREAKIREEERREAACETTMSAPFLEVGA